MNTGFEGQWHHLLVPRRETQIRISVVRLLGSDGAAAMAECAGEAEAKKATAGKTIIFVRHGESEYNKAPSLGDVAVTCSDGLILTAFEATAGNYWAIFPESFPACLRNSGIRPCFITSRWN